MNIDVKGYKNIEHLDYSILDNKLNVLIGVSGSGKSSIIGALKEDNLEFNKKLDYSGIVSGTLNGTRIDPEDISLFSDSTLAKYLFEETKNNNIYKVLIDNEHDYINARSKLDSLLKNIVNEFAISDQLKNSYENLQNQLGAKLTSTNKLRATSAIKQMEKSLNNLTKKRFYTKLQSMDKELITWRIKGEKLINNSKCPFCEKKLSSNKENELHEYSKVDISSFGKVELDDNQLSILNTSRIVLSNKGMSQLEKEIISIGIALKEYDNLKLDIENLFDTDFNIKRLSSFVYDDNLFIHFPTLRTCVFKLQRQINKLKNAIISTQNETKAILLRKINMINELLKSFGIPYEIQAKYKQSRIESYKLYHIKDINKIERINGLSTGERKIISLIFYVIEQKNNNKPLIVLDDPVSSYDENRRFSLFRFILKELNGKTVLIMSHDQSFAKYAAITKSQYIGKIEYFSNWNNISSTIGITSLDFDNINKYILARIHSSYNYLQKIINLRFFYELNKKGRVYSYLSKIIHKEDVASWLTRKGFLESDILDEICLDTNLTLIPFNLNEYNNIDTSRYSVIEKIFILREKINDKILRNEISNFIHLNTTYVITMNPYKYPFCSNYLLDEIDNHIPTIMYF